MQLFGVLNRMISMPPYNPVALKPGRLASLSDAELLASMKRLAAAERTLSAYALAQLAEIQRRKAYEDAGYSTMFAYCLGALGYSEGNTCRRLRVIEALDKYPELFSLIKDGNITICALSVIAKHLTAANHADVLKRIEGKSVRNVARVIAEIAPLPDTRDLIRSASIPRVENRPALVWPVPVLVVAPPALAPPTVAPPTIAPPVAVSPAAVSPAVPLPITVSPAQEPPRVQKIMPRAPGRVYFGFTGTEDLERVVERCREVLSRKYPAGRLEDIFLELGRAYLQANDLELLPPSKQRPPREKESRYIPRWVKSKVYRRDGGRCVNLSVEGRRCDSRRDLEFDHIIPWSRGGSSDDPENIRLLCRAHNALAARAAGLA